MQGPYGLFVDTVQHALGLYPLIEQCCECIRAAEVNSRGFRIGSHTPTGARHTNLGTIRKILGYKYTPLGYACHQGQSSGPTGAASLEQEHPMYDRKGRVKILCNCVIPIDVHTDANGCHFSTRTQLRQLQRNFVQKLSELGV